MAQGFEPDESVSVAVGTITTPEATVIANKRIFDRPIATLAVTRGCSTEAVQKNHRRVVHIDITGPDG